MSKVILFTHPEQEHITHGGKIYGWCRNDKGEKVKQDKKAFNEFIKSIKPYGEADTAVMPWNDTDHDRKFIECKCSILDKDYNVSQADRQRFWGEWEQPSRIYRIAENAKQYQMANYVHIPLLGRLDGTIGNKKYMNLQNTDPYVFGDSFYYCCCKQQSRNREILIDLNENDIIIFCGLVGGGKYSGSYRFLIDTVFVVDKKVCKYGTPETYEEYKKAMPEIDSKYVNGVLDLVLYGNDESLGRKDDKYFVLYKAKIYSGAPDGIFSFFPVKAEQNYGLADIPFEKMCEILDTEKTGNKVSKNRQQVGIHEVDSKEVWKRMKNYIVNERGYLMGIKAFDEFDTEE